MVIPETLQQRVIDLAHTGHQGIAKTKALLRTKVWFPSKKTEATVHNSVACQATVAQDHREPLVMSELAERPW